jgi:uncharacterized protein
LIYVPPAGVIFACTRLRAFSPVSAMISPSSDKDAPTVTLVFSGDLLDFFKGRDDAAYSLRYPLVRRASIKDIIESLGIPHTEIGRLILDRRDLNFSFLPCDGQRLLVEPLSHMIPPTRPSTLRPQPLEQLRFLVDINIAKLARLLRMAGLDAATVEDDGRPISEIAARAAGEQRILLSRNREVLKLRSVVFGRLVRNQDPTGQFEEISRLYDLPAHYRPFSRCMACNGELDPIDKDRILDRLEPLTIRYYHRFRQCRSCGRIYWRGSHHQRMARMFNLIEPVS